MAFMETVRSSMQYIAAVGAASLYLGKIYPQVWGLQNYKKVVQLYKDGLPLPLDDESKQIGQEVLIKMNLDPVSESSVDFFTVYGQEMLSKGSTSTRNGAIIGIPVNFRYKTVADVDKNKMTLNNESIQWDSQAGQALLNSLILSEKSKKFAIARELMDINSQHVQSRSLILAGSFGATYIAAFVFGRSLNLRKRAPLPARMLVYGVFGGIGTALYYLAIDKYNWRRDNLSDKQAAKLGRDYAEGGIEYYNQLLQRNMALRALMGDDGGKKYTVYGNQVHSWRSPHVPLTARRDNLMKIVESYKETLDSNSKVEHS